MRAWFVRLAPQAALGRAVFQQGWILPLVGSPLRFLFEPLLGAGASEMNQPPHPYLLSLEFTLGGWG